MLFIIYTDELITMMKDRCERETFIDLLHILLFMNDTVLTATTRSNILKVKLLYVFCDENEMNINVHNIKKNFVINGEPWVVVALQVGRLVIEHWEALSHATSQCHRQSNYMRKKTLCHV